MKILVLSLLLIFSGLTGICPVTTAYGQSFNKNSADISSSLARLQNNPRYKGRILGTHLRRSGSGYVYEVRILRDDDAVIIVFIDPQTGNIINDSRGRNNKNRSKKKKFR